MLRSRHSKIFETRSLSGKCGPIRKCFGKVFEIYGEFIGVCPWPFLVFPIIVTLILMTGVLYIQTEDDLRFLYSPTNAPARHEYKIHQMFTGEGKDSTYCALAVESANGTANLLSLDKTELIASLNRFVLENLTLAFGGHNYNFGRDICPQISFCPDSNQILEKFLDIYWNKKLLDNPRVEIKYPIMKLFDNEFFLPVHLFGVKTDNKTGRIREVRMVHMTYPIPSVDRSPPDIVARAFESSLISYLHAQDALGMDRLSVSMFSLHILKDELAKNSQYTLPFMSVTVILIVSFTMASCMTMDAITSKPLEALGGVFSSSLAIGSAGGLMFLTGVPYISQVAVMPFLALAIGVDDTFIMLGAWQRTDRHLSPQKRLALTFKEAASAITVTSLTDCLSFAIGALSTTPAISYFCKYVAAAIMFDYLYQITFFGAVLAIGGNREASGRHCILIHKEVKPETIKKVMSMDFTCPMQNFFATYYSRFLCAKWTRAIVFVLYAGYLFLAFVGCSTLETNLNPKHLLVDNSPLSHYIQLAESHMWRENLVGRVYVTKPPNFRHGQTEIDKFMKFVEELEASSYSMGKNSTQLWLRQFLEYWQYFDHPPHLFYRSLQKFLTVSMSSSWGTYLRWMPDPQDPSGQRVSAFFFTTGFRIQDWRKRTGMLLQWRSICAKYPEYGAVVYDENNFYSDQILSLPQTSMQAMGVSFICMVIICMVFISDRKIVFWVVFTLLSMDIGITGFLALGGADLSPTTIMNILMSIGLSVDFATHVGYRIYRGKMRKFKNQDELFADALGAIAWPVMQGGLSTLIAVFALQFVQSFVVRIFFWTIVLVVLLGMFHGLVVLPVILRTVNDRKEWGALMGESEAMDRNVLKDMDLKILSKESQINDSTMVHGGNKRNLGYMIKQSKYSSKYVIHPKLDHKPQLF